MRARVDRDRATVERHGRAVEIRLRVGGVSSVELRRQHDARNRRVDACEESTAILADRFGARLVRARHVARTGIEELLRALERLGAIELGDAGGLVRAGGRGGCVEHDGDGERARQRHSTL
jgi:hypothetical protein